MGCRIGHVVGLDKSDGNCPASLPANSQRAVVVLICSVRDELCSLEEMQVIRRPSRKRLVNSAGSRSWDLSIKWQGLYHFTMISVEALTQ